MPAQISTLAFVKGAVNAGVAAIDFTPYAPKASPTFTGDPKAPTPTASDNDTSIATTAFVAAAVTAGAPVAATAAEYIANSAPTKMLTPGAAWSAAAAVTLTESANVATPNLSLGLDFIWAIGRHHQLHGHRFPAAKILFSQDAHDFIRFGRDAEPPQQARKLADARGVRRVRTVCGVCPTPLTGRRKSCTR